MIELRLYQSEAIRLIREKIKIGIKIILLVITGGGGKCHSRNTPILMYDGSIKMVQDIKKGDLLMGNDSTPRKVLSTCKGREKMFNIVPTKGDLWGCNKSHILSLIRSGGNGYGFKKNTPKNVSLNDYLSFSDSKKRDLVLYRSSVEFKCQKTEIDPYFLGLWIGDGNLCNLNITLPDKEIHDYLINFSKENNLHYRHLKPSERCESIFFPHRSKQNKELVKIFRNKRLIVEAGMYNEKFIPNEYLINSREVRLQMLAGLLDTDGYLHHGYYEISTKYENLKNQILFLARSLGFAAYCKYKKSSIKSTGFQGWYYRISISGNVSEIPCKIKRKQAKPRKQIKNVLRTGFKVNPLGVGDYYGFELDGNGLYLLGDFTVTHNTTIAGFMISEAKKKNIPVVFIAHRKELIKQAVARIAREFKVDASIIMSGFTANLFNLVQVASVQTLQRRDLPPAGLVIVDEGHRAVAPEYLKILREYEAMGAVIIGLTGTPFSANKRIGLNTLYKDFVANIKCSELLAVNAVVPIKAYGAGSVSSKGMKTLGGDFRQDDLMRAFDVENVYVNLIYNFEKRAKDKKTIVFCSSVAHSIKCTEAFLNKGYKAMHIDGNTPSAERDMAVEYFRTGQVQILCNCSIACEGLDIPDCEAEILAVATKSKIKYLQCVWRIMRPFPGKEFGILIDMADNYERFADMGILPDGDIEVSLEPETKEESTGVAPVKLCPCCSFMNHASARSCNDCNEEFKKTKKEIQEEEFVELAKENKTRRWKGYKQKDWYKVKTEDLEEFAKVKGYKSFWVTSEKERRKSEHKVIKIINHPWDRKRYYQETSKLERIYYAKKPIDTSEFVFEKEDKMYIVFKYIKAIENEKLEIEN